MLWEPRMFSPGRFSDRQRGQLGHGAARQQQRASEIEARGETAWRESSFTVDAVKCGNAIARGKKISSERSDWSSMPWSY
jgi:hypothetical protein